ncbi:MAG TPA: CPBP family intramembrane glutamic endopeptidase, partial [Candidatus Polarisedimenticolia bacterium]|nr:CPBP family intramembrane glutamic endopeptidase [Candidatus Polarisedimenticolia bacterium]
AAFALAHAVQGRKSALMIFVLALVLHGLVRVTGSLLPAMAVHLIFDVVAVLGIARDKKRLDAADAALSGSSPTP